MSPASSWDNTSFHLCTYVYNLPKKKARPHPTQTSGKKNNQKKKTSKKRLSTLLPGKQPLLLISISFTPKTSHSGLKNKGTLRFPATKNLLSARKLLQHPNPGPTFPPFRWCLFPGRNAAVQGYRVGVSSTLPGKNWSMEIAALQIVACSFEVCQETTFPREISRNPWNVKCSSVSIEIRKGDSHHA